MNRRKHNNIKYSHALKIITALLEVLMAIPVVSWMIIVSTGFPIFIMLLFHTLSLIVAVKSKTKIIGNVLGIFASFLAIFPVVGWLLHVITVFVLFVDVTKNRKSHKVVTTQMN